MVRGTVRYRPSTAPWLSIQRPATPLVRALFHPRAPVPDPPIHHALTATAHDPVRAHLAARAAMNGSIQEQGQELIVLRAGQRTGSVLAVRAESALRSHVRFRSHYGR